MITTSCCLSAKLKSACIELVISDLCCEGFRCIVECDKGLSSSICPLIIANYINSPQFSAHICCGQMAAWIKMSLVRMELGLGPGDFVLDGDPAPPSPKGGPSPRSPKFSAHVYCGQTAGWMKLVLGMEVGLSPGDFVLDGDPCSPLLPKRGGAPPHFRPTSIVAKQLDASRRHFVLMLATAQGTLC